MQSGVPCFVGSWKNISETISEIMRVVTKTIARCAAAHDMGQSRARTDGAVA